MPLPSSSAATRSAPCCRSGGQLSPRFGYAPVGFSLAPPRLADAPRRGAPSPGAVCGASATPSCSCPAQDPLEAKRAHSVLLAGHVPHRSKPHRQGKKSVLKHGSREHRYLPPTASAKPEPARNRPSILPLASRATKACRPAQREKILPTRGIVGKAPLQFHRCARVVFGHSRPLYLGVG